jgi:type I restriction enzyme S subunit
MVALGEVAEPIVRSEVPNIAKEYRFIGVKWWGAGVYEYARKRGNETKAPLLFEVRTDDIVINKIWARHGSISVVPNDLNGAHGSSEFPTFIANRSRLDPCWIGWWSKSSVAWAACAALSYGTSGKNRIQPRQFLSLAIPLPPLAEQRRIVARLNAVAERLAARNAVLHQQQAELDALLHAAFARIIAGAPKARMGDIAPLVRRPVAIKPERLYTEIGVRSFFRGIFHRRTIEGVEFTWQNLFEIAEGDIVFSNLMAWEKAIGLAGADDDHCVGNHRMLTCQPDATRVIPRVLHFYFSTPEGFTQIEDGSPGSIARNKTLSPVALQSIEVPVPSLDAQHWFDQLHTKSTALRAHHAAIDADSSTLLPAMLNQIFT